MPRVRILREGLLRAGGQARPPEHWREHWAGESDELINRCYTLADLPRRYPLVPRYEHWGIRRCVYGNYLIFYRVREDAVDIVHVLHGAMDYESMLFPDA